MKSTLKKGIAVGLLVMLGLAPSVFAGQKGNIKGNIMRTNNKTQERQQLRDGSCVNGSAAKNGAINKNGKTFGPGDGTGPVSPKDGAGYGAPTQQ